MQQILSSMTPDQLQDANRLCLFPVKRRLILQDLGFMDGDESELDFRFSLCDIGTWTIYPIAVIDMVSLINLVSLLTSIHIVSVFILYLSWAMLPLH